jgi:tripartite-type tricarboxylate transporter receptor subunit TctC
VNPSFPAKTVPEFIAHAKAHPGEISFASAGNGSVAHVTGELFKMMTGVNMLHVPYRGAPPALTDLIGGQVHVMFDNTPSSIEHIRARRLRPLVVTAIAAADLPRKEPPRPAPPVGKAPIGKYPVGKYPIGKYPQPVVTKG